jgi:alpha-tubulin suppressor-like RCC1 family protein
MTLLSKETSTRQLRRFSHLGLLALTGHLACSPEPNQPEVTPAVDALEVPNSRLVASAHGSGDGMAEAAGTSTARAGAGLNAGGLSGSPIATGGEHSCAIVAGGEVKCWGNNWTGQLGDDTLTDRPVPVTVVEPADGLPLAGAQSLALGTNHSCALVAGGEVKCWGDNEYGQLGDGTRLMKRTPVSVLQSEGGPPLTGVQALASGEYHNCALLTGGEVKCWGVNSSSQIGNGTTTAQQKTPASVLQSTGGPPLTGVQDIALGSRHSCAVLSGGGVRCWGYNKNGQLGDGTTDNRKVATPVLEVPGGPPLPGAQFLALGGYHSCARMVGGDTRCWGSNGSGELGDGTNSNRSTPVTAVQSPGGPPLLGAQALALGYQHACALTGGEIKCWGSNLHSQLGDGTQISQTNPVSVLQSAGGPPLGGVQAIASSQSHSCAVLSGGEARCWGDNYSGQLGDGTLTDRSIPVRVKLGTNVSMGN